MGRDSSFEINKITSYCTFANQPLSLDPKQERPTNQYIFDSSTTDAFYQPFATLAYALHGNHPIIHAIQPDGSTIVSMGKKNIPLTNTNIAIQQATDGHTLPTL